MTNDTAHSDSSTRLPFKLPPIVIGTSALGNLYVALDEQSKCEIIAEYLRLAPRPVVFDTAGKYGAGLALEALGNCLTRLNVSPDEVIISNKLAWVRTELKTPEPTFEPGVWKDLKYDAVQKISYAGIIECFEQGNELLGQYAPQLVSVHDPDEYLAQATDEADYRKRFDDILDAYKALFDLKAAGKVKGVGVGAKDWKIIKTLSESVNLDWVMIANSLTIKNHPQELLDFVAALHEKGVTIINSAVFHSGFLVGGNHFDYKEVMEGTPEGDALLRWRDAFFKVCDEYNVKPAEACVKFAFQFPGVSSIALSTSNKKRIEDNLHLLEKEIPPDFWKALRDQNLISPHSSALY